MTLTGNSLPASVVATRFSGVDTSGTNGSGAIEATANDPGPASDSDNIKVDVTTVTDNAWAFAAAWHRVQTMNDPPDAGETSIQMNNLGGSSGDSTRLSTWYEPVTPAGTVTLGADNDVASGGPSDWAIIGVSIKPGGGSPNLTQGHYRWRNDDGGESGGSDTTEVSSIGPATTTGTGSYEALTGMSITPGAGDYLVWFSGTLRNDVTGTVPGVIDTTARRLQLDLVTEPASPAMTGAGVGGGGGRMLEDEPVAGPSTK